jgi:hypothetical protein
MPTILNSTAQIYSIVLSIVILILSLIIFQKSNIISIILLLFGFSWLIVSIIGPVTVFPSNCPKQSSLLNNSCSSETQKLNELTSNCKCAPIGLDMHVNKSFQIVGTNNKCLSSSVNNTQFASCDPNDFTQWYNIDVNGLVVNTSTNKCLVNNKGTLIMDKCDSTNPNQVLTFNQNGTVTNSDSCLSNITNELFVCPQPSDNSFDNFKIDINYV